MALAASGVAQELGQLETFEGEGRKVGSARLNDSLEEYSLLSRQMLSYQARQSAGFRGELSIKKTHEAGGFEILMREYRALCESTHGHPVSVTIGEIGSDARGDKVETPPPHGQTKE